MSVVPPTERRGRSRCVVACVVVLLIGGAAHRGGAQGAVLLQGVADGEAWSTTSKSNLLTRNAGRPAELARVQLWGAFEPARHWVLYAQGEVEAGNARNESGANDVYSNQFG